MPDAKRIELVRDCIIQSITLLNQRLTKRVDVTLRERAPLFGGEGPLDSISLVSLIADVEEAVEERWNVCIVLATDRAFSRTRSPFKSVGELADYADDLIEEKLCKAKSR
jgi:hypothetical protein